VFFFLLINRTMPFITSYKLARHLPKNVKRAT
jgi:hypothetical protein